MADPEFHSLPVVLRNGVRFRCTDCGACCTGAPGRVRVSESEIQALAAAKEQDVEDFRKTWLRKEAGEWLVREQPNGDCVLFEDGRCSVHEVKPTQCRLYPFWFRNVRSESAWERTCHDCPGIGEGDWISPEEILQQVQEDLDSR
jgi:Fe-S-cluster containining protein